MNCKKKRPIICNGRILFIPLWRNQITNTFTYIAIKHIAIKQHSFQHFTIFHELLCLFVVVRLIEANNAAFLNAALFALLILTLNLC